MKGPLLLILFCCTLLSSSIAQSSSSIWTTIDEATLTTQANRPKRVITPRAYNVLRLDATLLQSLLNTAPLEGDASGKISEVFEVLMPNG